MVSVRLLVGRRHLGDRSLPVSERSDADDFDIGTLALPDLLKLRFSKWCKSKEERV
jgi:hypothetical protein